AGALPNLTVTGSTFRAFTAAAIDVGAPDVTIRGNTFLLSAVAVRDCDGDGLEVLENTFAGHLDAVLVCGTPGPTGIVLTDNLIGLTNLRGVHFAVGAAGRSVDARCNEWGVYHSVAIRATRIRDDGTANAVQHDPFWSLELARLACLTPPAADFGISTNPATRNDDVLFTDRTVPGARPVLFRTWTFGDGGTSTDRDPTHRFADVGTFNVTLTVTDADGLVDSHTLLIEIRNLPPELVLLSPLAVDEGVLLDFNITVVDPDGDESTVNATGLPPGAVFPAEGGPARFLWRPGFLQAGTYDITFVASDGRATDEGVLRINVADVNQPPELAAIGDRETTEGTLLTFTVEATDVDGDPLAFSAGGLPSGATFDAANRTFSFTPGLSQNGTYPDVEFSVSDGRSTDREEITIRVADLNRAPVFGSLTNRTVSEGNLLSFTLTASDADGDPLSFDGSNFPVGSVFDEGTGAFSWRPTFQQAGLYPGVEFAVSDGKVSTTKEIQITVLDATAPPVLSSVGSRTYDEGDTAEIDLSATDPDGDVLLFSADGLPAGALFDPDTGLMVWVLDYDDAGTYPGIVFGVSDGVYTDTEEIQIVVRNVDREPVLAVPGTQQVRERSLVAFVVSASDPDGDPVTISAIDPPTGATFSPGNGSFRWVPDETDSGTYDVTFEANDGALVAQRTVRIEVLDNARPIADFRALPSFFTRPGVPVFFDDESIDDGTITLHEWDLDGDSVFETSGTSGPNRTYVTEATVPVSLRVTDDFGYLSAVATRNVIVDGTAPVTTSTVTPAAPDGENGWYVSTPTVSLSMADLGGSGCDRVSTFFGAEPGAVFLGCTGSLPVGLQGLVNVSFQGSDRSGNIEGLSSRLLSIDRATPSVCIDALPPVQTLLSDNTQFECDVPITGVATVGAVVPVSATVSDGASGIRRVELWVDGSLVLSQAATDGLVRLDWDTTGYAVGPHVVRVRAYDAAGHFADHQKTELLLPGVGVPVVAPPR
ncbi:MAG: putative Ig domain-containing protein, partial [Methanobacteriota archaeon]